MRLTMVYEVENKSSIADLLKEERWIVASWSDAIEERNQLRSEVSRLKEGCSSEKAEADLEKLRDWTKLGTLLRHY